MRLGRTVRARNKQGRWLGRLVRGLRPDRNPLRRTSDRVESYLLAGLLAAALAGAPFAAQAASHAAHAGALRAEQAQLAALHQVRAVITEPAGNDNSAYTLSAEVPVQAAWTSPAGERRTADILAPAGTPKGTAVTIWTDAQGNLSSPPLQPSQIAGQADVAALGAIVAVAALYLCATGIVRYVMYRRRMAAWDADWAVTAQTWNRQRW
jgi:hypothetical protein